MLRHYLPIADQQSDSPCIVVSLITEDVVVALKSSVWKRVVRLAQKQNINFVIRYYSCYSICLCFRLTASAVPDGYFPQS
ncbi:hypothetical protein MIR68_003674 [Amoeboaphelidium protococcarum]|nr:hypothetical protein MIR68_012680 [Amoeboaphelidium protococcarum]KAI3638063.1 hypothetical protein MIR68_003674 [Amoeboaphelidium protococcarum]